MENEMNEFVEAFLSFDDDYELQMEYATNAIKFFDDAQFLKILRMIDDKRKEQWAQCYQYMVTFTIDPKKHPVITDDLKTKIVEYIELQKSRPALKVRSLTYAEEKHEDERPHWHAKFITTKPLRSDAFKVFKKNFGNPHISRTKYTKGSHTDFYINKENPAVEV